MLILILALSLVIIAIISTQFLSNQQFNKQPQLTNTTPVQTLNRESPDATSTANWKTYAIKTLNIEFKLPPKLTRLGELEDKLMTQKPSFNGSMICMTFNPESVPSGQAYCNTNYFSVSAISADFDAVREIGFQDAQGYVKKNGNYYEGLVADKNLIPKNVIMNEIENPNGIKILKLLGKDDIDGYRPLVGSPGEGNIGALINTSNKTYPGFSIVLELKESLNISDFNQILSTFKFVE